MTARVGARTFTLLALATALVLAGVVSSWASSSPDGLESVAERFGFAGSAAEHAFAAGPLADYSVAVMGSGAWSTGLAGVAGCFAVLLLALGAERLLRARR